LTDATVFPPFISFLASPLLIAIVAWLHVSVSHFAIGGGFLLYIEEKRALKYGDEEMLDWLKGFSKTFLYITLTFGALTGVAIWFIVGVLSPLSTTYLIMNFAWIWAIEWVFFLLEVFTILLYVGTWDRAEPRLHLRIGLIYFLSAWLSLFFINGILTFQLTPSKIREPLTLFKAFFNHTFFPSLFLRTFIAVWIASLFFLFFLAFYKDAPFKRILARRYFRYSIFSLVLIPACTIWYGLQIPKIHLENFSRISYLQGLAFAGLLLFLVSIALSFFLSVLFPQLYKPFFAVIPLLFAVMSFGFYEWIREDLRLPYLVSGVTYGNDINVKNCKTYQDNGFTSEAAFLNFKDGQYDDRLKGRLLFDKLCASCHTIHGVNPLEAVFSAIDEQYGYSLVRKSTFMKAPMPPFAGNDEEAGLISKYIRSSVSLKPAPEKGKEIFRVRCAPCHDWERGYRTLKKGFEGLKQEEIYDMLGSLDTLTESMPMWSGSDAERKALSSYIASEAAGADAK
jgi:mono/diheme cytochrome c family protein